jgi:hypothetical protein
MDPNAQASASKPASQAFDFGDLASMNSTTAAAQTDDGYVPPVDSGIPAQPKVTAAAAKVDDDDDDLVVGQPLDQASGPAQPAAPQAPAGATGNTGATAAAVASTDNDNTTENDGSGNDADNDADHGGAGGQVDPRMAQYMAQQKAAEQAAQRQGGGGGGSPGLSGLVMAAGSGAVALTAGGFKMLSNGVKAINGHDPSRPARKTVGEFLATRDPNNAEAYYSRAGDKVVSNRIYRDSYHGMHDNFVEAKAAEALFQEGVGEMRDILNNSGIKALADAANSSIGDYIHDVKSGKIVEAAAQVAVQTLEQSTDFKAAESKIVSAGETFGQKQEAALAKMATLENSFPGKADTQMVKNELANLADGMKGDDVSKASAKVKKIMDDIEKMANAIKEAIRKTIDKVVSLFQPK